jgi:hypothetical protein
MAEKVDLSLRRPLEAVSRGDKDKPRDSANGQSRMPKIEKTALRGCLEFVSQNKHYQQHGGHSVAK